MRVYRDVERTAATLTAASVTLVVIWQPLPGNTESRADEHSVWACVLQKGVPDAGMLRKGNEGG